MTAHTYLRRRSNGIYYARLPVPLELQQIVGKKEFAQSLRTSDLKIAKRALRPVIDQWHRELDRLAQRREITDDDLAQATWQHYSDELDQDREARATAPTPDEIARDKATLAEMARNGEIAFDTPADQLHSTIDIRAKHNHGKQDHDRREKLLETTRDHLAKGETVLVEWAADQFIADRGLLIERDSAQYRDLCKRLQRAQIEALKRTLERDDGDYTGQPADPIVKPVTATATMTAKPGESVLELFEEYATENPRGIKPDTMNQNRHAVRSFAETVGASYPAAKIDRKAVREWKALLLKMPVQAANTNVFKGKSIRQIVKANEKIGKPVMSTKTVNRHLAGLSAYCDWLVRNDILDSNPVHGMLQAFDRKRRTTLPFSTDQLNAIFASPLFTGCESDTVIHKPGDHKVRDHRYWLPLIMLFSGARTGEIAQLLVDDVRQQHGHWVFHITDLGDDDKSVKTAGSNRVVPVHPELVRLGLIKHCEKMRARGEKRLFPEAERNERGQMAAKFSREFPRYLERIGVRTDKSHRLYSFRHGFIDALRRAGYLDEQFGFLLGHTSFSTTGLYGTLPQGMLNDRITIVSSASYAELDFEELLEAK